MNADAARRETRAVVHRLVLGSGGKVAPVPIRGMPDITTMEPEPLAGIAAARAVELNARRLARDCIRTAREAGHGWARIGEALGLTLASGAPATAAFDYAAGLPLSDVYNRTMLWVCPACGGTVSDRGPDAGANPADAEPGHADGCTRLAEAVTAYEAQWEDEDG